MSETIVQLSAHDSTYYINLPHAETDYIQSGIVKNKIPYEVDMLDDMRSRVNESDLVVDVGANIGNHTLYIAAQGCRVYAFEPNSELSAGLQRSIELNHWEDRVTLFDVGVGKTKTTASFLSHDPQNLGASALILGRGDIKIIALDDLTFPTSPAILKVDVEGMEEDVLLGAKSLIASARPLLYVECQNKNCFRRISNLLCEWCYFYWDTFNATPTHLFIPSEKISPEQREARRQCQNALDTYETTRQFKLSYQQIKTLGEAQTHVSQDLKSLIEERNNLIKEKERLKKCLSECETQLSWQTEQLQSVRIQVKRVEETLSFRLGYTLLHAGKSPRNLFRLPLSLYQIWQERQHRKQKKTFIKRATISVRRTESQEEILRIASMRQQAEKAPRAAHEWRIAAIMDEFTFFSYAHEATLLQLSPSNSEEQLEQFAPHMIFIESAWEGTQGLWKTQVSQNSENLQKAIRWGKAKAIPVIFWNKEDPVHFSTFLPVAQQADIVFTTDIDLIPKYKALVGHDRVYCLPFAAQPKSQNPIEKYDRKNLFNFAGSYYAKYIERQKDFAAVSSAAQDILGLEIYDRNYGKNHPHYEFPAHYKPMILGKLAFSDIDRAYKGYRYGINMNSVKKSQTMFARRVFDLMASNTVIISNFSRGLRSFFGDLVISSDNTNELIRRISPISSQDVVYRKYRLLGLRKVISEHTYKHRLHYILNKVSGADIFPVSETPVLCVSIVHNDKEMASSLSSYENQNYTQKNMHVIIADEYVPSLERQENVIYHTSLDSFLSDIYALTPDYLVAILLPDDYYGPYYLADIALAVRYTEAPAFGKAAFYEAHNGNVILRDIYKAYTPVENLPVRSSLVRVQAFIDLPVEFQRSILTHPETSTWNFDAMLALDEFHYIRGGALLSSEALSIVQDLPIHNQGASLSKDIYPLAEALLPTDDAVLEQFPTGASITASELFRLLSTGSYSSKIKMSEQEGQLFIQSGLPDGQHSYCYIEKDFTREELHLASNSFTKTLGTSERDTRLVLIFQDSQGQKISHVIQNAFNGITLVIPPLCTTIRLGLRISGPGLTTIKALLLGEQRDQPQTCIMPSPYLVLTKQYPSYDDLYKYGFLHSRIREYKKQGLDVGVFRIRKDECGYHEFENIDVLTGMPQHLDALLSIGTVKHVLVHMLDKQMFEVLSRHLDTVKVTVWIHGAEIQPWQRRDYEFTTMTQQEIERKKRLSAQRMTFWKEIFSNPHPNLHFVFVSEHFKEEVVSDIGIPLKEDCYAIIHNYIDGTVFPYVPKNPDQVRRILSISPFSARKYANDLMVKAIQILSQKPLFSDLQFTIVGEGDLFDDLTAPLRAFPNVTLERKFIPHDQIAGYHKNHGIFLRPTRMDAQGVSRDEAMSSGLVPITNAVAAVPEFVDEHCGCLAPGEDPQGLADAIERLVSDRDLFLRLSEAAAARVRRQSGFDQTIKKEIALIKSENDHSQKEGTI